MIKFNTEAVAVRSEKDVDLAERMRKLSEAFP